VIHYLNSLSFQLMTSDPQGCELGLLFLFKTMFTLGIDPGWASCGVSLVYDDECIDYMHYIPRDCGKEDRAVYHAVNHLSNFLYKHVETIGRLNSAYMERYVAYAGVQSSHSEDILMFIGAVKYMLEAEYVPVNMVRAADWKPKVCKYLVRTKGFKNPSSSFDKKYSIAAANALSGKQFKTDHEADAVCMSYLGEIDQWNKEHKK
jgi:hypothetical protein